MDQATYNATVIDDITGLLQPRRPFMKSYGEETLPIDGADFLRPSATIWYDIDFDGGTPFAVFRKLCLHIGTGTYPIDERDLEPWQMARIEAELHQEMNPDGR